MEKSQEEEKMAHLTDVPLWIQEQKDNFRPPICNSLLHADGHLKVFFVGGPNVRKDFHIEEGEEFFYMVKGDMCLKVLERGHFRDISIKQGEVFLLPSRIPHSPQRSAETIGLVVERERSPQEMDGLRYFVGDTTEVLFERWFHCQDLGPQLTSVVQEFFNSQEYKLGKPLTTGKSVAPYEVDASRTLDDPFLLGDWIREHRSRLSQPGGLALFGPSYRSDIAVLGTGTHALGPREETFLWQLEGISRLTIDGATNTLSPLTSALVPGNKRWQLENQGVTLKVNINS